ncbi:protein abnormal spindle [Drosophila grimshawi]|uniref:GH18447 n=1 Tax=Drosophila grimshawi TaxID=7222 RepID=B4JEI7_DROGR|nr:protein abnormal spindle [Drosophila grimshawi]EDV93118.1 GH18447 [Drosophila grimshawi]
MSAFEVTVTPSRLKQKKRIEGREPAVVVMAPFSAKAIVQFEDVPITKTAKRIVRVLNPSDDDIEVKVTKAIREEHNLSLEWMEKTVPAFDEVSMELVWNPQLEIACKETLQLVDNRNFRKDVMIILKSKCNQPARTTRKFPTVGKTLHLKSPTGNSSKTHKTLAATANHHKRRMSMSSAAAASSSSSSTVIKQSVAVRAVNRWSTAETKAPLSERNAFKAAPPTRDAFEVKSFLSPKERQCKENVSPMTPANVFNLIDNMQFTPMTEKIGAAAATPLPDNLAAWPTPTLSIKSTHTRIANVELQPRRLGSALDDEQNLRTVNETFDVKRADVIEISVDTLDYSRTDQLLQTPTQVLNKTTTIVHGTQTRALACIREEDVSPPQFLTESPTKLPSGKVHDLKRDINVIGSPLRKYSESMKNLSLLSPQSKLGIQGSMPNLNEMLLPLRSIEQNRYFQQQAATAPQQPSYSKKLTVPSPNSSCSSEASTVSHPDMLFNQCEILAQSSRFNLHEVGGKQANSKPQEDVKQAISGQKRRSHELSFSDAPSNESLHRNETLTISPPKRQRFDASNLAPANASARAAKVWPRAQPKKFKLAQTMALLKKPATPRKMREQPATKLYDSDLYMQTCINPDPFAATTTADPFLASTMYLDEQAVERHQVDFRKWLNALVSIPADLDADTNSKIDVGKLFNEVRNKELSLAPTKEEQSMNYLTKFRLESLRRAAVQLFFSEEMRLPCSKVAVYVQKQALRIRSDRNLHLDVVMQRTILELLLCFNPLWLRLGLEVVFGEKLHLQSNRDIVGLSTFILNRLFRNRSEEQKFSKAYTLTEEYAETIKKHTLQKILFLLLFLDLAKQRRIIKHNPCLFVKKSPHKETKEILQRFSSELLANLGDITRELRRLGYVLQHKQTFLDEFDYAFSNLAVDLRDGVRLTRVMEVILLRDNLTQQLRVPAISRLQRIFNVKLALGALRDAQFELSGDISAADIVDGYREKTLSLLWQLCYKFRSPKFHAAACVLQQWWRRRWLYVFMRRRIRERAAIRIQAAFRGHQMRKYCKLYRVQRLQAVIVLQKYTRRYFAQKRLFLIYHSVVTIQVWWRAQRLGRQRRQHFRHLRQSAIFLQRIWRRRIFARKLLAAAQTARLQRDQKHQAAAACIQMHWRAYRLGKEQRRRYLRQQQLIVFVQRYVRSKWQMQHTRNQFLLLRQSTLVLQRRYRARLHMLQARRSYEQKRECIISLQRRWRAKLEMRRQLKCYRDLKRVTTLLQIKYRARIQMRLQRQEFVQLKAAAVVLQRRYRARLEMLRAQRNYAKDRQSIINLQRRWRATLEMRRQRHHYRQLKICSSWLQSKQRARMQMRRERHNFIQLKQATVILQQRWRARQLMHSQRQQFQQLRRVTINIQRRFRADKAMRFLRAKYRGTQTAVSCLQLHWRNYLLSKSQRQAYVELRLAAINVQRRYRAQLEMRRQRNSYQQLKLATIQVQRRYRAQLAMRKQRQEYQNQRALIVQIQQRYRAKLAMKTARQVYQRQRQAAISIQRRWRALLQMRLQRQNYQRMRNSSIILQRKWRATLEAQRQRQIFRQTVAKVRLLQRHVRATLLMRQQRQQYQHQRQAALILQRRFRARQTMLVARAHYQQLQSVTIWMQRKFRATRSMRQKRSEFLQLRRITIHLQQKFRGKRLMLQQQEQFRLLTSSIVDFQSRLRGYLARMRFQALMTPEMIEYLRQKRAAKVIQRYWRGYRIRRRQRHAGLIAIRKRLLHLRHQATAMNSVRAKVQDAVRILRGRFIASDALTVLNQLDRISRTVPHTLMCCSEFMSTFCYGIMAQAIRSEVDKQLIERCSRIILNLARYNSSTINTFQEGGLVTIAQMLMRWCDKDSEIFNTLCTLIWVFAHCPKKRRIIHDYMTDTEAIYMVRETKKLVARKEKMKQNARKTSASVIGRHGQQTPNFSPRALPSLQPDFGIIRSSPYTFISSVFAFDTILSKLNINV